ncbi:MAG TPA: hypothetical protein DCS93_37455 [Microscillaceae bacterium]|nr:hypothetical protein [Microscillaceae bacterium]
MLANFIVAIFWTIFIIYVGSNFYTNLLSEYKNTPRRRIRRYYQELEQASRLGEAALQVPFQNLLYDYAKEYGRKMHLANLSPTTQETTQPPRVITGHWESVSLFTDLDAEVNQRMMLGYPRQNIIFENTHTAILIQQGKKVAQIKMDDWNKLHHFLLKFVKFDPMYTVN